MGFIWIKLGFVQLKLSWHFRILFVEKVRMVYLKIYVGDLRLFQIKMSFVCVKKTAFLKNIVKFSYMKRNCFAKSSQPWELTHFCKTKIFFSFLQLFMVWMSAETAQSNKTHVQIGKFPQNLFNISQETPQ